MFIMSARQAFYINQTATGDLSPKLAQRKSVPTFSFYVENSFLLKMQDFVLHFFLKMLFVPVKSIEMDQKTTRRKFKLHSTCSLVLPFLII